MNEVKWIKKTATWNTVTLTISQKEDLIYGNKQMSTIHQHILSVHFKNKTASSIKVNTLQNAHCAIICKII